MTQFNVGNLQSEIVSFFNNTLSESSPTDVFEFDIVNRRDINLFLYGISAGDDADLRLFQDSNGNGILDSGDQELAISINGGSNNDAIGYQANAGKYFAEVSRFSASSGPLSYSLDLSGTFDLGFLKSGLIDRRRSASASDPTDVYEFDLRNNRILNLYLYDISAGDDVDLNLYFDSNRNGVFDSQDRNVASSRFGSNSDDVIDYNARKGTYFVEVERYAPGSNGSVAYNIGLSATIDIGTLTNSPDQRNGYSVTPSDPTDVYEFDLASNDTINLLLHNITNRDDADLALYEDTNNNGIFDVNDAQIASSSASGNADETITYVANAGTYFAEVSRYDLGSFKAVIYDLDLSIGSSTPTVGVPETYQPFNASQVFSLHSNSSANHTIYLDFNGHTTAGTQWNSDYGTSSIVTPAFDANGDTSAFSSSERETIWQIWRRVAEDFAPFNVDVTTEAPPINDLIKSSSSDTRWGVRAVIGGDGSWISPFEPPAGIAYLPSFNDDVDTPTFIFSEVINSGEIGVAETISHEVGHTLGLEHDGYFGEEYYEGHGSGTTSWAPIMGIADFSNVTQWSAGEYVGATTREDDLDIITGQNGFGYRLDDYGDSLSSASTFSTGAAGIETYGIIETNTDFDWFEFTSTTGNINLDINAFERGANLDILSRLYDSAGQIVRSSNPASSLSASFSENLSPGQYYLSVTGTGTGNPSTGYSGYASIGQYSIVGTIS